MSIPSVSSCIDTILEDLKKELRKVAYGEVGIIFTLHNSAVSKVRQIKSVKMKIKHANGQADMQKEEELIHYEDL